MHRRWCFAVYPFELRRLRQSIDAGQTLSADDARALLDEVETLRHAVRQPTELHLTARIDVDDPSRWTIDHPLLTAAVHAHDVADALTLAAIDLRRNLEPAEAQRRDRFARHRVNRAEWRTVEPTREAEHGLRLLSLEIPGRGNTVSQLCAYRDATTNLLGAHVSVAGQRGAVGGGCWPFDLSSIALLTGGMITPDDLATWASPADDDPLFSFAPHWELLWLADAPDDRR